jgi:acetyl-CoA carboxylase biotin carboxyl carrier protein
MTIDEIRELIQLVNDTGVAELEVERGGNRVRICSRSSFGTQFIVPQHITPQIAPQMAIHAPAEVAPPAAPPPNREPALAKSDNLTLVKSPIVGTFYEAASPDTPPFVRIGEQVAPGKILCIIESMKLMNEIEADIAGIVESRLVQNGQPVEYGEALFGIRPL